MEDSTDYEAQCLIDDGEGVYFLCPVHKREDALTYFDGLHNYSHEGQNPQQPFPQYLQLVSNLNELVFYEARIDHALGEHKPALYNPRNFHIV